VLHQALVPCWLATDLVTRLQREMLCQWLDQWSAVMAAASGGGRAERGQTVGVHGRSGNGGSPQITAAETAGRGLVTIKDDDEASIRHRAYLKWLGEGRPDGQHLRHYFEAAREVQG
jgi:Protein of unknown function (DUF2934)